MASIARRGENRESLPCLLAFIIAAYESEVSNMGKTKDLTGKRFGKLYVVGLVPGHKGLWHCKCDCGKEIDVYGTRLSHRERISCGCLNIENRKTIGCRSVTHGMTNSVLYKKYSSMKGRCNNPHYKYYSRYGGRGIKVCKEWEDSFEAFMEWAYSAGYDDNKNGYEQTLDRIDTDGNYCPENCKWSNQKEQVHNRSISVHMIGENGQEVSVYDFAKDHEITNDTYVYRKLRRGATAKEIIEEWNVLQNGIEGHMTVEQARLYYGVCNASIMNWIYSGRIKAEKHGQRWYIPVVQEVAAKEGRDRMGRFLKGFRK